MTEFPRVKEILDQLIAEWGKRTGRSPFLGIHSQNFGWETREKLLQATAFNLKLIEVEKIGSGLADETNLIQSLRTGATSGGHRFPRMPPGGPYASEEEVKEVEAWINNGCN